MLSVKQTKTLFRKKIIQSSQLTTFTFKSVELATFSFKTATFLFKTSIFSLKLSSATFSLFQNCHVPYIFIENYQVCHFHRKLFSLPVFQMTLSSTLLLPFFNSDGLATFPFKSADFVTLIRSSLLLFYWKRSSSLLFIRNCQVRYFFQFKSGEKYQFATFLSKTD